MPLPAEPDNLRHLFSTHRHLPGSGASKGVTVRHSPVSAAQSAAQHQWRAPAVILQNSVPPRSAGSTCHSMLQRPHRRMQVSLPALKPVATGSFAPLEPGCFVVPLANQAMLLSPPSRSLPCFNAGPQVQNSSLCRTSLLQPHRSSNPCRDSQCTDFDLEEPNQGRLRNPGLAKTLSPLFHSGHPKPKIP